MKNRIACGGLLLTLVMGLGVSVNAEDEAAAAPSLLFILDASGSMWGQIDGENKIVIAREVFKNLVGDLPDAARAGLVAYGHRREGDCDDIETILPIGPLDRDGLVSRVNGINPKGKTPITKSVQQGFDVVRASGEAATIILVSDGLETCGGDPCAAVRLAKAEGLDFVMHVVGFDVADEDVSQLECAAQAGGGMFRSAESAGELGSALDAAVAMTAEVPAGRLSVRATADGELQDAAIHVTDAESGKEITSSRTYDSPDTNPRLVPLPDGTFDVEVEGLGIQGDTKRRFQIQIVDGSLVEKAFDFSTGEIRIGVTRNGELSDAVYRIYVAGTREEVETGRTYTSASSNPSSERLLSGRYDVEIGMLEIEGEPKLVLGTVVLEPGASESLAHDHQSGELRVSVVSGGEFVNSVVQVISTTSGKQVAQARTYTSESRNAKSFTLEPGEYVVKIKPLRVEGASGAEFPVAIEAGETVEKDHDFGS